MAKEKWVAARPVPIGTEEEDPDRPGLKLNVVYETGEAIDVKRHGLDLDTLMGLEANGYIKREG